MAGPAAVAALQVLVIWKPWEPLQSRLEPWPGSGGRGQALQWEVAVQKASSGGRVLLFPFKKVLLSDISKGFHGQDLMVVVGFWALWPCSEGCSS